MDDAAFQSAKDPWGPFGEPHTQPITPLIVDAWADTITMLYFTADGKQERMALSDEQAVNMLSSLAQIIMRRAGKLTPSTTSPEPRSSQ